MWNIFIVPLFLAIGVLSLEIIPAEEFLAPPKNLTLTPGDLKVFAGHALTLLQKKCPKVNPDTVFGINKFIAKEIAKHNPALGNDPDFKGVIKVMTSCETEVTKRITLESEEIPEVFFFSVDEDDDVELVPISGDDKGPQDKGEVKVQLPKETEMYPQSKEKVTETKPKETKAYPQSKEKVTETEPKEMATEPKSKPAVKDRTFVMWISDMLSSVRDYFSSLFGGNRRSRRDTEVGHVPSKERSGLNSGFGDLFTEVCRIYCDMCEAGWEYRAQVRISSGQLVEHLTKIVDEQRLKEAVKHHLTGEFMKAVKDCQ